MLKSWTLENFKSIKTRTEIDLAPLTLFCGTNSSGKSSLLQSMLLVVQTFLHHDTQVPLLLNGLLCRLGEFHHVVSHDVEPSNRHVTIGWSSLAEPPQNNQAFPRNRCPERLPRTWICECSWSTGLTESEKSAITNGHVHPNELSLQRNLFPLLERSTFTSTKEDSVVDLEVSLHEGIFHNQHYDVSISEEDTLKQQVAAQWEINPDNLVVGAMKEFLFHGFPEKVVGLNSDTYDEQLEEAIEILNSLGAPELAQRYSLEDIMQRTAVLAPSENGRYLPDSVLDSLREMKQFFSEHIHYIGPLREEPRSLFEHAYLRNSRDTGIKGEKAVAVLFHKQHAFNEGYMSPKGFSPDAGLGVRFRMAEAVTEWLNWLGVADSVRVLPVDQFGYRLEVFKDGVPVDMTRLGVGFSQVFPIVVLGLAANKGDTLILEQPELHLHPKVQSRLADFFLMLSKRGVQCLIETHSEHLISRLRYWIAASKRDLRETLKIYFVEKDENESHFRPVDINEYGAILDWPKDFFDQTDLLAQDLLRASLTKMRKTHPPDPSSGESP